MERLDAVVIGAGVGGLQCARRLALAGWSVRVAEKSRGVGGRVATRRVDGQPYDKGLLCLHGRDKGFLEAVRASPGTLIEGWPRVIHGGGTPPVGSLTRAEETRLCFAEGLTRFPKSLAEGLDVRLQTRVLRLEETDEGVVVHHQHGAWQAGVVVLATPVEQARELLDSLPRTGRSIRMAWRDLSRLHTEPCLSLAAFYDRGVPEPLWDVYYPREDAALMLISHDSRKREVDARPAFVAQAHPTWSRAHLEETPEQWGPALLEHLAAHVGDWALDPVHTDAHRWRYAVARRPRTPVLPAVLTLAGGGRVGITGAHFAAGQGVQAAWRAGETLAQRLLYSAS